MEKLSPVHSRCIAVFTASAALIVYSISNMPELRKVFFWSDDVQVISLSTYNTITVLNVGDGKVFLSSIDITTARLSSGYHINKILNPGEILTHLIVPREEGDTRNHKLISGVSQEKWSEKIRTYQMIDDPEACVGFAVLHERDPMYLQFKNFYGKKFQTVEVRASLHFFSLHKREAKQQLLPVHGVLFQNAVDRCPQ